MPEKGIHKMAKEEKFVGEETNSYLRNLRRGDRGKPKTAFLWRSMPAESPPKKD
jgi:hypothetical protein